MQTTTLVTLLSAVIISANAFDRKVCYPSLGCFSTDEPWFSYQRPVPPPQSPQLLNIRAFFYSSINPTDPIIVDTWPIVRLNSIPFDPTKRTFFITHGYQDGGDEKWLSDLKDALLKRVPDANVFIGDWIRGAKILSYFQACSNLRIAAAVFVKLLMHLIEFRGLDIKKLHIMGHSLGGQICGQIGKAIPGIHRITAFDPSQPMFEGLSEIVRLNKNDADNVDVVHADAQPFIPDIGFGAMNPVGHIDYFMNGGHGQPGCRYPFPYMVRIPSFRRLFDFIYVPYGMLRNTLLCPHGASHDFWIEAVNFTDCVFWGYPRTWKNMLSAIENSKSFGFYSKELALGGDCTYGTCSPMGLESFDFPARGEFVITTRGFSPYCLYESVSMSRNNKGQARWSQMKLTLWVNTLYNETLLKETGQTIPGDYDYGIDFDPDHPL